MVNTLKRYNILPRKTYDSEFIFPFDKIPEQFYRPFIRWFIDGDGSYEFNGKGIFTIRLVSTSRSFLDQIGNIISSNIEGMGYCLEYHKGKTIDWYTLRFQTYGIDKPNKILPVNVFFFFIIIPPHTNFFSFINYIIYYCFCIVHKKINYRCINSLILLTFI